MATIVIPTPLRKFTNQQREVNTDKTTVKDAIKELTDEYPELKKNLLNDEGKLHSYVKVYIGDDEIESLDNGEVEVNEDTEISIVPAIAGGIG